MQSNKRHKAILMSEFIQHVQPLQDFATAGRVELYAYYHIPNQHIQLVQNAPDDGPMRSETCRANISAE